MQQYISLILYNSPNLRYVCALLCLIVQSCLTLCDPIEPARLLCPWDSSGKNTGVGCHALLQEIFLTQESNQGLMHYKQILCQLSHQGSPSRYAYLFIIYFLFLCIFSLHLLIVLSRMLKRGNHCHNGKTKQLFFFQTSRRLEAISFGVLLCSSSPFQHPSFAAASMFVVTGRRKRRNRKVQSHGPVQFSSVTQSCLTLCKPIYCSSPGLPTHHQLSEFTQTCAH